MARTVPLALAEMLVSLETAVLLVMRLLVMMLLVRVTKLVAD